MKRAIGLLFAFLLGMGVCLGLFYLLSGRTPVLYSGESLPKDIGSRQYLIAGEQDADVYVFRFICKEDAPELTMTISDAAPFELWFGDAPVYAYREDSPYSRNIVVQLGKPRSGENEIRLVMNAQGKNGELLFGPSSVVKLLLGSEDAAIRAAMGYRQVFALITGAYLALIYSSVVLYIRRPQEKYLFAFMAVCFLFYSTFTGV